MRLSASNYTNRAKDTEIRWIKSPQPVPGYQFLGLRSRNFVDMIEIGHNLRVYGYSMQITGDLD